jgi:hypothetical protein
MLNHSGHQLQYGSYTHVLHHAGSTNYSLQDENIDRIDYIEEVLRALKSAYWQGTFVDNTTQNAGTRTVPFTEVYNISDFINTSGVVAVPFTSIWTTSIYVESKFNSNSITQGSVEYQLWRNGVYDNNFSPLSQFDSGSTGQDRVTITTTRTWNIAVDEGDTLEIKQVIPAGVILDDIKIELNINGNNINAAVLEFESQLN